MSETRIYKKLALVLSFVLALSFCTAGCSYSVNKVTFPQKVNYFIENNLEIETVSEDFDGGFGEYIQISGLKDNRVEDNINEKLYDIYVDMKENDEVPPYRGIKQKVTEDSTLVSDYIYTSVGANINNILSLYFIEHLEYENSNGEFYFCSDVRTVNFDLNTGDEISLKDVFCDDVNYEEFLNEYIEKSSFGSGDMEYGYYGSTNTLKLTAPFKGVTEEQKFYINQYDGSIELVFDHTQPEVYCEYDSPVFYKVDIGENSALAARYYDEKESLYIDEVKRAALISKPFDVSRAVSADTTIGIGNEEGEYQVWVYSTYYDDMPAGAMKYAKEHLSPDSDALQSYMKALEGYGDTYSEEGITSDAMYIMECSRFADYTNVETIFGANIYSASGLNLSSITNNVYSCFKDAEYKPLDIQDIFISKEDAKAAVIGAFVKNYEDYIEDYNNPVLFADKAHMERFFDEAYDKINGFIVTGSYVMFSYDGWDLLLDKHFPGEDNYIYGSFCEMAEYADLGVDKLSLF